MSLFPFLLAIVLSSDSDYPFSFDYFDTDLYLFLLQSEYKGVYLISTISEWLVASAILTFGMTYTWDFRYVEMESPKILLKLPPHRPESSQVCITEITIR